MLKAFRTRYDEDWSSALYECYSTGDDSVLNDLMTSLYPLVRVYIARHVKKKKLGIDRSLLEADAFADLLLTVQRRDIHNFHPKSFTRYLERVIYASFAKSVRRLRKEIFEFWRVARDPYSQSIPPPDAVEAEIYQQQLNRIVHDTVVRRIRFLGTEREACEIIVECILGVRPAEPSIAQTVCNLRPIRYKYLLSYSKVLIRSVVYEIRENERKDGPLTSIWPTG